MFVGVHMMLAHKTNTPELIVQPDEAAQFMHAAQNVMRHYSVEATQKTLDWIAFAGVAGGMYLTRGIAIAARRSQEKTERAAAGPRGQVLRFRKPGQEPPAGPASPPSTGLGDGLAASMAHLDIEPDALGAAGFQPEAEPA